MIVLYGLNQTGAPSESDVMSPGYIAPPDEPRQTMGEVEDPFSSEIRVDPEPAYGPVRSSPRAQPPPAPRLASEVEDEQADPQDAQAAPAEDPDSTRSDAAPGRDALLLDRDLRVADGQADADPR